MDKLPRFAKVFAGRRRIVEMDISLRLRNLAEFFNSLLGRNGKALISLIRLIGQPLSMFRTHGSEGLSVAQVTGAADVGPPARPALWACNRPARI
jgi:hypothetical protein